MWWTTQERARKCESNYTDGLKELFVGQDIAVDTTYSLDAMRCSIATFGVVIGHSNNVALTDVVSPIEERDAGRCRKKCIRL